MRTAAAEDENRMKRVIFLQITINKGAFKWMQSVAGAPTGDEAFAVAAASTASSTA